MIKKFLRRFLVVGILLIPIAGSVSVALGVPPPWAQNDKNNPPPVVSAPEPTALSLIGLGLAGVAGYRLIRRKRKK